jgi:hypothetical protein
MSAIDPSLNAACMLPASMIQATSEDIALPIGARKLVWLRFTRLGDVDVSLLRPLIAAWPTSQADVTTLEGQRDAFGEGVAAQVNWAALEMSDVRSSVPSSLGPEVSAGLSFRVDGLLAGRVNRPLAEVNIGIAPSALVGAGDARFAMLSYAELRVPLPTLFFIMLAYSLRSSALADGIDVPAGIGPYGVRVVGVLPARTGDASPTYLGWDVEVAYVSLTRAFRMRTSSTSNPEETELRLRFGRVDLARVLQVRDPLPWTFGLELSGGWSWFL